LPAARWTAKAAGHFIWELASKVKVVRHNIERLVEERRRNFMDPDVQAGRVIDELLVGDAEKRAALKAMLNTQTGSIRKTLTEGIPELFAKDFYIEMSACERSCDRISACWLPRVIIFLISQDSQILGLAS
jgi:hypothetical protein